jgi:hypothetical protein
LDDPAIRKGALSPYGREREAFTLRLLHAALLEKHARPVPEVVVRHLQEAAPRDIAELLPYLEQRGADYASDAISKLEKRSEAEAKAMREILETQQKRLIETVARYNRNDQLTLGFNEEERRQLESNQRYWAQRLASLDIELKTEPDRIRGIYQVRAQRI